MRRVVVTGMGILSPLGRGVDLNWKKLMAGVSGIKKITSFDVSDLTSKIAGLIPLSKEEEGFFDPDSIMEPKEQRHVDPFILYGVTAGVDAVEDSGWKPETEEDACRTGVLMGAGIGGIQAIYEGALTIAQKGARRVSPFFIPSALINLTSGHISIRFGFKGPNHSVVTACATGTHAIGDACRLIQDDQADVMVAGGSEAAVCRLGIAGFAQARALSTNFNETPEKASRPWDMDRDGFIMGEGAGALVLEEYEHAKKRGAKIYGEVVGYGLSSDAYHVTSPGGGGALRAVQNALKNAKQDVSSIDYVNAHGTSTPLGDKVELQAIEDLCGMDAKNVSMSSTKSATGHLLGAAGAIEAIYSLLTIKNQTMPATLNLENPFRETEIDLVPLTPKERKIEVALSNSFGFGGTNASLVFKKI
ncbi:MAG: beta-ketoacyl-ACP synthase II [Alphaproteobacteria bacterium]|nr:beta-ketoacyl-ACP synthase II [Alphaproteobacteria bacterium]